MPAGSDVVIIGGGIIGLAAGREAARRGLRVLLIERGTPGCEASGASAGMLAAQADASEAGPLLPLLLKSRDLYPDFLRQVRLESGVDPQPSSDGTLRIALREGAGPALDRQHDVQRRAGLEVRRIDGDELRRLEPALAPGAAAALHLPRDVSMDGVLLMRGLHIAAARAGVDIRTGVEATGLVLERGRVVGVAAGGERLAAAAVVIAAGAWSGDLAGEGIPPLPCAPVRGQILCLRPRDPVARHILWTEDCYLVPRPDGRVLVGSTLEHAGFDKRVTAGAVAKLAAAAVAAVPALAAAAFETAWAGLRPKSGDDLPAIGPGPRAGLFYATGHLRHGMLLAPLTARLVAGLLQGEEPEEDLAPFSPLRFARG